jgi:hypothetical protein
VLATIILAACGGGGSGGTSTSIPGPANVPAAIVAPVNTAMYQAPDGVGQSKFIDITLSRPSYIDVTNFLTSVQLYSPSLVLLVDNLNGSSLIQAGPYKLKVTYTATAIIPGTVTFYSTALTPYKTLKDLRSARYDAVGSLGAYSEYYKLTLTNDTNIDVTTSKANVYVFNVGLLGENVSLLDNFAPVSGNKFLTAGEYIVKISYVATSLTPGSVTVYIP